MKSSLLSIFFIFSITSCDLKKKEAEMPILAEAPAESLPAKKFTEIQGVNQNGDSIRYTDIKSKYVLVEFWASWCPPCRQFNPHLVNLYKLYQPKGLEVLSISLDHDNEKWKNAIAKDGLIWPYHISDLGGWDSHWAIKYGIESIPSNFLIDSSGNVIASNMTHEQIANTLSTLLK
jgi:thiol-disulfide isomerase/thioredoxin